MTGFSRPNIALFMTDQQADSIGASGNPVTRTPNFDALAARGTRCAQAFSQHRACSPSRIAMMTAWYPHVAGQPHVRQPAAAVGTERPGDVARGGRVRRLARCATKPPCPRPGRAVRASRTDGDVHVHGSRRVPRRLRPGREVACEDDELYDRRADPGETVNVMRSTMHRRERRSSGYSVRVRPGRSDGSTRTQCVPT